MQVATDFIFDLVNHHTGVPFVNTFTDKTNDFFTVLVAEIDRNAAEALIEQVSDGLIGDDVFPDLLNGYTDVVSNTRVWFL